MADDLREAIATLADDLFAVSDSDELADAIFALLKERELKIVGELTPAHAIDPYPGDKAWCGWCDYWHAAPWRPGAEADDG